MKTTDFVFYAILTLLYRVEQPSGKNVGIASRCVEAARLGLDSHIKHFDQSRSSSVMRTYYVHWCVRLDRSHVPSYLDLIH